MPWPGLVHRDLKPSNVLYDAKTNSAKVCDLGLGILLPPGQHAFVNPKGTLIFAAPEMFVEDEPTTHACDVFSFAITSYVFLCGKQPYANRKDIPDDKQVTFLS